MRINRHAFSLVEIVTVVVLIAVTAAIALPRYAASLQHYQLDLAAQRIVDDLSLAQWRANNTSTSVTIAFSAATNSYQIVGLPDFNNPSATYTVSLAAPPYAVQLTSAVFGSTTQMVFNGYGTPTQGGTIIITLSDEQHTITVDATTGRAVIQ